MSSKIKAAIVGASGYSGQELLRVLAAHPHAQICAVTSTTYAGRKIGDVLPVFQKIIDLKFQELVFSGEATHDPQANTVSASALCKSADVIFLSVPHSKSMEIVSRLTQCGNGGTCPVIIDLSADYRIKHSATYKKWYQHDHTDAPNLAQAVYGLPELHRKEIKGAKLVANPGCYATSILLALYPAAQNHLPDECGIIVDAKSGVSGAGKTPKDNLHFPEMNENFAAYKVGAHQHLGEIMQELQLLDSATPQITFVPHLAPLNRGIYATIYFRLKSKIEDEALEAIYRDAYKDEPFVRLLPREAMHTLAPVTHTNFCDLCVRRIPGTTQVVITSTIDNLLKGAAGQAIQNMNIIFNLDERTGLL